MAGDALRWVTGEDLPAVAWRASAKGCSGGNCVEAGLTGDESHPVAIRQSRDRRGPVLLFALDEWLAFIRAVKAGVFDLR
jgi:hypothetical protein